MKDEMDKVHNKLDKISEDVQDIKIVLAQQAEQLRYHILRTDLAEENMTLLRKEFVPIKKHVQFINNLVRIVIAVGGLLLFLNELGLLKLFRI